MRAGVSYDETYDVEPDIGLDSDDVYIRNSSQIDGEWNICALDEIVNIETLSIKNDRLIEQEEKDG